MSNWKVSKTKISLFVHPNADSLSIGKVGSYQVVVQKGIYNDGDEVIFVPEKSVLTGNLKVEYEKYLAGPEKNRVKSVRLRGEISSGIIIPSEFVANFNDIPLDEDISESLGISHYEPPIPTQLAGKVKSYSMSFIGYHDCEHANVYVNDLIDGERVVITSKIHGSQTIYAINLDDMTEIVSSKGLLKSGLILEESDSNTYWNAVRNTKLKDIILSSFTNGVVQVFGEVAPVQSGFSYGFTNPHVLLFDVRHNGVSVPYDKLSDVIRSIWVPIVYDGPIDLGKTEVVLYENPELGIKKTKTDYYLPKFINQLAEVKERVSGKELHIEEGVVVRPYIDRNGSDGTPLRLKVISKHYKESGEEIN